MLGGPPQHALLRRRLRKHREHELEYAAGRIGAMREVAMVAGADTEHAQPIERYANRDRLPRDAGPERRDAGEVHQHEWDRRRIDDVAMDVVVIGMGIVARRRFIPGGVGGIERHECVLQANGRIARGTFLNSLTGVIDRRSCYRHCRARACIRASYHGRGRAAIKAVYRLAAPATPTCHLRASTPPCQYIRGQAARLCRGCRQSALQVLCGRLSGLPVRHDLEGDFLAFLQLYSPARSTALIWTKMSLLPSLGLDESVALLTS